MGRLVMHLSFSAILGLASTACTDGSSPFDPQDLAPALAWGPETPPFNLQVILQGEGFGLVRFRQPNDSSFVIYLDTWVRGLQPNTSYSLQRAVDTTVDDVCTSEAWLTLGKGLATQAITTDEKGTGREELFRDVTGIPVGNPFDIHFRVIDAQTAEPVLQSECYQYAVSL